MNANLSTTAVFTPLVSLELLTVLVTGGGSGTVSVSPGTLTCDPTCTETYAEDTLVTVFASPATGSVL